MVRDVPIAVIRSAFKFLISAKTNYKHLTTNAKTFLFQSNVIKKEKLLFNDTVQSHLKCFKISKYSSKTVDRDIEEI